MSSELGISEEKILALDNYRESPLFSDCEKAVLDYAGAMTRSDEDVDDQLFQRLRDYYDDDTIVDLTAVIAWENASSKFNRALRIDSQNLWQPDRNT